MPDTEDDDPTLIRRSPAHQELLDARNERDELLTALAVPDGIEPVPFATLLRELYAEVIHRAGLERADPSAVALVAAPQSLLGLACGRGHDPGNPLVALTKPPATT